MRPLRGVLIGMDEESVAAVADEVVFGVGFVDKHDEGAVASSLR